MKRSSVSAFARVARLFALAAAGLALGAGQLLAQGSTGKIEGHVRDQAGAPVASAQVVIVGTAFVATANQQGYFFINNVPSGTVNLKAVFVGYKPVEVSGLKVLAGQTVEQDITLEQTPIEISEITVVGAQNVLVPRDQVTSKTRTDGDYLAKLPVDRINQALALVPGVVASASGNTISIRGGRSDENVTYIDGVPVSGGYRSGSQLGLGGVGIGVSRNGVEEASVTTGASAAEFGNAQSGILALQTRTGGPTYSGNLSYNTDEPMGVNHGIGYNRIDAGFGGPIFKTLTFYLNGTLEGQRSADNGFDAQNYPLFVSAGKDVTVKVPSTIGSPTADTTSIDVAKYAIYRGECNAFSGSANADIAANYGLKCQGIRTPSSAQSTYQIGGKLNYSFGTGSRVFVSYNGSQTQGPLFSYVNLYDPSNNFGFRQASNVATFNWTQNLSKSAEKALALEAYASYQWDRSLQSPLTPDGYNSSQNPFGGFMIAPLKFVYDFNNFPLNQVVENYRSNTPNSIRTPYDLNNIDQYNTIDLYRNNAYGLLGFTDAGGPSGRLAMYKEDRAIGKLNLDWQVDRYNRVKVGGEYTKYYLTQYSHTMTTQIFSDAYREKPVRWNTFIEDHLDLGDVIVVAGLRYDYFKTNALRWNGFPRISTAPGFNPADPTALLVADPSHNYLSPHVQVSFPVTERTNFRLSYAHQVQTPDFAVSLQGINTDYGITNTNQAFGTDLGFGKTITFEFGIRHSFSDDMVLDISAYNKDNLSNASLRLINYFDPVAQKDVLLRVATNQDFGNTRGIDLKLDRRFGNLFNGTLSYTFQDAKNTGSDPYTYINFYSRIINQFDASGAQPPPQAILPTNSSRPHNLAGSMALNFPDDWKRGTALNTIFRNFGVTAIFRYASGTAYTRCPDVGGNEGVTSGGVCSREFVGTFNGSRLPAFKQFDMKFTKGFHLGGKLDLTAYADVRNILNLQNILSVFAINNDVVSPKEQALIYTSDSTGFALEAAANNTSIGGIYTDPSKGGDGSIDLTFGGATAAGNFDACTNWTDKSGTPRAPNCVYLIRAEERYGNGDHIFTLAEQQRASQAYYLTGRGLNTFTSSPRRIRFGLELNF
jgi:hypothetical protein